MDSDSEVSAAEQQFVTQLVHGGLLTEKLVRTRARLARSPRVSLGILYILETFGLFCFLVPFLPSSSSRSRVFLERCTCSSRASLESWGDFSPVSLERRRSARLRILRFFPPLELCVRRFDDLSGGRHDARARGGGQGDGAGGGGGRARRASRRRDGELDEKVRSRDPRLGSFEISRPLDLSLERPFVLVLGRQAAALADEEKLKGNTAFGKREYAQAAYHYSLALDWRAPLDRHRAVLLSNRSACFLKFGELEKALDDAEKAVAIDADYCAHAPRSTRPFSNLSLLESRSFAGKAIFRHGLALHALERYREALPVLGRALSLEPKNKQIIDALRFAEMRLA